jgi:hypothetical protein
MIFKIREGKLRKAGSHSFLSTSEAEVARVGLHQLENASDNAWDGRPKGSSKRELSRLEKLLS